MSFKSLLCLALAVLLLSVVVQASGYAVERFDDDVLGVVVRNVDDYEHLVKGSDAVLRKYKTLEDLEAAVKVCTSPCRAPTKVEVANNLKNTGRAAAMGIPAVKLSDLPKEADDTIKLIEKGGPFPYPKHDGKIFENRVPPGKKATPMPKEDSADYYKEYTVVTPGAADRAKRRIVSGRNGELYYTDDHFETFKQVMRNVE
jgi:ribonuclease T1